MAKAADIFLELQIWNFHRSYLVTVIYQCKDWYKLINVHNGFIPNSKIYVLGMCEISLLFYYCVPEIPNWITGKGLERFVIVCSLLLQYTWAFEQKKICPFFLLMLNLCILLFFKTLFSVIKFIDKLEMFLRFARNIKD